MSVVQTTEQYPISQLDYVRIQVPCPYFNNLVMDENTQDLNHQLYQLHGIGHCKNIKGCYTGHVSFGVSSWKSSFPCCLCCCFLMVLVYLMQMALSLKKPEDESELRCSFLGSSSSVISYRLFLHLCPFFFCTEDSGHFHPLFILSGFCLLISFMI